MYNTVNDLLTAIANAIRTKTGKSEKIATQDMPTEIENIQTGGGSEIPQINDLYYYIYNNDDMANNIEFFYDIMSDKPTKMYYTLYNATGNSFKGFDVKYLQKFFNEKDFSEITSITNSIGSKYYIGDDDIEININLPNCTNLSNSLGYLYKIKRTGTNGNGGIIFNFNGSTKKVAQWTGVLSTYSAGTCIVKEILNINMDNASNVTSTFNNTKFNRLTFDGSFGGLSTSSSLTINLSSNTALTVEAFLETMTTISENTNGKTRIFKLPAALYDSLTDEILDLADEKGYTLSS